MSFAGSNFSPGTISTTGGSNLTTSGVSGSLQYNNGNSGLTGSTSWKIDTSDRLSGSTPISLLSQSSVPTSSFGEGTTLLYPKSLAGKNTLAYLNSGSQASGSSFETYLQDSLLSNNFFIYCPAAGTTLGTVLGDTVLGSGTVSHPVITAGQLTPLQVCRRTRFTTAGTSGSNAGFLGSNFLCIRGDSSNIQNGGFTFFCRFGLVNNISGSRVFLGLGNNASFQVNSSDLTLQPEILGIGFDSYDDPTGSWSFYSRGVGAASKVTMTNMTRNTTDLYDCYIYTRPTDNIVGIKVINVSSGTVPYENNSFNTNLPSKNVGFRLHAQISTGSGSSGVAFDLAKMYLQTIY